VAQAIKNQYNEMINSGQMKRSYALSSLRHNARVTSSLLSPKEILDRHSIFNFDKPKKKKVSRNQVILSPKVNKTPVNLSVLAGDNTSNC